MKTFPNLQSYEKFSAHPNYKLMGAPYAWFYMLRPIFFTYIFVRMTRTLGAMIVRHYEGKDDLHYYWYYDSNYPDMLHDEEDMRYQLQVHRRKGVSGSHDRLLPARKPQVRQVPRQESQQLLGDPGEPPRQGVMLIHPAIVGESAVLDLSTYI